MQQIPLLPNQAAFFSMSVDIRFVFLHHYSEVTMDRKEAA